MRSGCWCVWRWPTQTTGTDPPTHQRRRHRCCPPHSHPPTSARQGFVHPWDAHPHHHHEHIHFVQEEIGEPTIVGVSRVPRLEGGVPRGEKEKKGNHQERHCRAHAPPRLHRAANRCRSTRSTTRRMRTSKREKRGRTESPGRTAGSAGGLCEWKRVLFIWHRNHRRGNLRGPLRLGRCRWPWRWRTRHRGLRVVSACALLRSGLGLEG